MSITPKSVGLAASAACLIAATGCGALEKFMVREKTQSRVAALPASVTNVVRELAPPPQITISTQMVNGQPVLVAVTNQPPSVLLTNTILVPARVVTNEVAAGYEANPQLLAALRHGQQLNSLLNPSPSAPLVNLGLGLLSALATGFAAYKTRQQQQVRAELEPKAAALATVIKAIELFPGGEPAVLKEHIQTHAHLDRTQPDLDAEVQSITA